MYTFEFFNIDICCSPLLFTNVVHIDSPTYLRPSFFVNFWPPRYHHINSDYLRDSRSDKPTTFVKGIGGHQISMVKNFDL